MKRENAFQFRDIEPKPAACPACGETLDGATNTTGTRAPKEGDWSVCAYCGTVLRYVDDRLLRELHDGEVIPDVVRHLAEHMAKHLLPRRKGVRL